MTQALRTNTLQLIEVRIHIDRHINREIDIFSDINFDL